MLDLIVMRHAQAQRRSAGRDFDRALDQTGKSQCARIGAWMRRERVAPAIALSSDARRARETCDAVLAHSGAPQCETRFLPELYDANETRLFALLHALRDGVSPVLLVGHNPALTSFAIDLCGDGDAAALNALRAGLPTGAIAWIAIQAAAWSAIARRSGYLARLIAPDSLETAD